MPIKSTADHSRRKVLRLTLALAGASVMSFPLVGWAVAKPAVITVWKTPNCGCCKEWVKHLQKNGFEVVTHDVNDTGPIRQKAGLAEKFGSCHTALLGGYVLEGHVPAQDIHRLLREKPNALGLAVPGMPLGSPGMEMGPGRDAYEVVLVLKDGNSRTFQSYPAISSINSKV